MRSRPAVSWMRTIFSTVRAPHDPGLHRRVVGHDRDWPPVDAADAGDHAVGGQVAARRGGVGVEPVLDEVLAPSSHSSAMRSRQNSLPAAALLWWYLGAPPCLIFSASAASSSVRPMFSARSLPFELRSRALLDEGREPFVAVLAGQHRLIARALERQRLAQRQRRAARRSRAWPPRPPAARTRRSRRPAARPPSPAPTAATTRVTMPSSAARAAGMRRPVRISSLATAAPATRASRCVPPAPGMIPRRTSSRPISTPSAARRRSQASASSSPPPKATPLIAAITGAGKRASSSSAAPRSPRNARVSSSVHARALLEIGPGAERLVARAGDHDRAHPGLAAQRAHRRAQLGDQRARQRVHRRGPVERDPGSVRAPLDLDGVLRGHPPRR